MAKRRRYRNTISIDVDVDIDDVLERMDEEDVRELAESFGFTVFDKKEPKDNSALEDVWLALRERRYEDAADLLHSILWPKFISLESCREKYEATRKVPDHQSSIAPANAS